MKFFNIKIKLNFDKRLGPRSILLKRIYWKIRWVFIKKPKKLKLITNQHIYAPKIGTSALIFYYKVSEPETYNFLKSNIKHGDVFYDIGAHLGEFTIIAGKLVCEEGEVHAFEPIPYIFDYLINNIKLNKLNNVKAINKVVSNESGPVTFEVYSEPSISRINLKDNIGSQKNIIRCDAITIDEYIKKNKLPNFVKIDVEGAELFVLEGMVNLLSLEPKRAPVIVLELLEKNCKNFGYSIINIIEFLNKYNYKLYDVKKNPFINYNNKLIENNLVAIKKSN